MSVPSLVAVIDDDEDVRISLEMLIVSIGHEAVLFESADALLAAGGLDAFFCFISDVQMPGTDGIELARRLRQVTSVPVILVTAFASTATSTKTTKSQGRDPNAVQIKRAAPSRLTVAKTTMRQDRLGTEPKAMRTPPAPASTTASA